VIIAQVLGPRCASDRHRCEHHRVRAYHDVKTRPHQKQVQVRSRGARRRRSRAYS
jgi:hypothetical protein